MTKDMQATAASLILWLRDNMPFGKGCAGEPDIDRVTDDSKVTDHHAMEWNWLILQERDLADIKVIFSKR